MEALTAAIVILGLFGLLGLDKRVKRFLNRRIFDLVLGDAILFCIFLSIALTAAVMIGLEMRG